MCVCLCSDSIDKGATIYHINCSKCNMEVLPGSAFEHKTKLYCQNCYAERKKRRTVKYVLRAVCVCVFILTVVIRSMMPSISLLSRKGDKDKNSNDSSDSQDSFGSGSNNNSNNSNSGSNYEHTR